MNVTVRERLTVIRQDLYGANTDGNPVFTETEVDTARCRITVRSVEEFAEASTYAQRSQIAAIVHNGLNVVDSDLVDVDSPDPRISGRWRILAIRWAPSHLRLELGRVERV